MIEIIDDKQFDELIKGELPVVCDFFATWCVPCNMLAPVMDKCSELFSGKAKFVKVDIDKGTMLPKRYGVMSIPLVVVFKNGEIADKSLGYCTQSEMEEFLNNNL